jgi:hypothetical protein
MKKEYINKGKICSAHECDRAAYARGYCIKHYERWRIHGDINVNYHRRYRKPNINFVFDLMESKFRRSYDETNFLRLMLEEAYGSNECENVYKGKALVIEDIAHDAEWYDYRIKDRYYA